MKSGAGPKAHDATHENDASEEAGGPEGETRLQGDPAVEEAVEKPILGSRPSVMPKIFAHTPEKIAAAPTRIIAAPASIVWMSNVAGRGARPR